MTLNELHIKLQELGVSEEEYYLHGLYGSTNDNDKLALSISKGKYNYQYEIYFRERGEKRTIKSFSSENEACDYLLREFKEIKLNEQIRKSTTSKQ
ncbi:hypothetical protein U6A24_09075 [Aquimarina gracilis]|uniref:Uncharacterized protein n=1 Tax=Aquimarina gracilis TaxID=874422 RepID=A0ABU5ZUQ2_9FLAO|nr:hypothetical protein [Aquimarina gracilis]MEB3345610.1 hypothetical protein [Aquimarina gracilis]